VSDDDRKMSPAARRRSQLEQLMMDAKERGDEDKIAELAADLIREFQSTLKNQNERQT
jgi:hypothetical protein